LPDFPKNRLSCKACNNAYRKDWVKANPERAALDKVAKSAWRSANIDKARKKTSDWVKSNRDLNCAKAMRYIAKKANATPCWLTDIHKKQIQWFYSAAKMMTDTTGERHEVDHIHPLQGDGFNGLHVPWNLQIINKFANASKGNRLVDSNLQSI